MRLDTLCLWRNTWLTNRAMIFFQITYLRDRRLGNLISLNHRLLCLPAACFIIVIILSFVLLTNDTWIPNTKGLYKSSEEQKVSYLFIPSYAHSLSQSYWVLLQGGNAGHTMGLYSYSSCRFTWEKCSHISKKMSGLLLFPMTLKEKIAGEKKNFGSGFLSLTFYHLIWLWEAHERPDSSLPPATEEHFDTFISSIS